MKHQITDYHWDLNNNNRMGKYLTSRELQYINAALDNVHKSSALDVGCATGKLSFPLMNMGFKVVGLDYDFETLPKYKNQYEEAMLINANAEFLPLKASIFNCVIAVQMLSYLSNRKNFFKEAKRIIKPGGLLFITFNNKSGIRSIAHKFHKKGRSKVRQFYPCNYPEIVEEIQLSELQVINAWGYNWNLLPRNNDTVLVDLFAMVEKLFMLKNLPYISPSVFIVAKKSS